MIFVNFKTYKEASGKNTLSLTQTICDLASETKVEIIACPQAVDLRQVIEVSNRPVWTQHVDAVERGRATGWFPPEVAKEAGAEGTFLNHSEHKLSIGQLGEIMARCRQAGLKTLVFADSVEEAKVVSKFKPDYIGYEPQELIASKTTSVSQEKPEIIRSVVKEVPKTAILIGAGVKGRKDVQVGIKLGATGIVLSSAVVLAKNPKEVLKDLVKGFK
ncbi:triosephosphate isomerase [Patescibacteria group bacterium]|nr:triosephosphate isomerase [Patescibacteria group bacterium]